MSRETDYTTIARRYDQRYMVADYHGIEEALLEFVDPKKEVDVLEVGCGTGHWLGSLNMARAAGLVSIRRTRCSASLTAAPVDHLSSAQGQKLYRGPINPSIVFSASMPFTTFATRIASWGMRIAFYGRGVGF